ncbi:conserved hypothetical protein [Vibrio nigripulchritudo MADA3029]|uniref:hypothetical protein n=1 Tax=Vibrio nigripulchritudo TaxID=28173 RepID=UPI0003B2298D|nr:hypothetical protein [Vibrio nigripulchritudo]CCN48932.1 conserved hypothetical protein [Vibrio nigripulchritudo MADA3020]CCN53218.1 conserved hypothetical protein [Vibrio nigripulchritudo MADA3021]CCN56820.1 conserved hypothetical protein [Vibrio nigripulchritudo MADA3029]
MTEQVLEENQIDVEQIEELEAHSEQDEKALLAELNGEDFDPESVIQRKDPKHAAALEAGKQSACAVLGLAEQGLKMFGHKDFEFDPEGAESVANAAAPLLVKYGGELPPWLADYKEEIIFVGAVGMLGFGSVQQIKARKAFDKAKEVEKEESESEPTEEVQ